MNLKALLAGKSRGLHTISHDLTVEDAVRVMTRERTPALLVVRGEEPLGILTESDILQSCVNPDGRPFGKTLISDILPDGGVVAEADEGIDERLAMMLESGTECLPVAEDGRIFGLLFLRDLMQHRIEVLTAELVALQEYVSSLQDAIVD
jgi:CBS domain-containing protein